MSIEFLRFAGWAAFGSAVATVVALVTTIIFFSAGQPFGTVSDISSVVLVVLMIPVAAAVYVLLRSIQPTSLFVATFIGIVGMVIAATFQTLLVVGLLTYEQVTQFTLTAGGAIGIWLLMSNYLALRSDVLPAGLAWAGMLAGVSYVLVVIGFWISGQESWLFYIGSLGIVIGYSVWTIGLGRLLVSSAIEVKGI